MNTYRPYHCSVVTIRSLWGSLFGQSLIFPRPLFALRSQVSSFAGRGYNRRTAQGRSTVIYLQRKQIQLPLPLLFRSIPNWWRRLLYQLYSQRLNKNSFGSFSSASSYYLWKSRPSNHSKNRTKEPLPLDTMYSNLWPNSSRTCSLSANTFQYRLPSWMRLCPSQSSCRTEFVGQMPWKKVSESSLVMSFTMTTSEFSCFDGKYFVVDFSVQPGQWPLELEATTSSVVLCYIKNATKEEESFGDHLCFILNDNNFNSAELGAFTNYYYYYLRSNDVWDCFSVLTQQPTQGRQILNQTKVSIKRSRRSDGRTSLEGWEYIINLI